MAVEQTEWIEFVPVWEDPTAGPEVTIRLLEADAETPGARDVTFVLLATLGALLALALSMVAIVAGVADGTVILPGIGQLSTGVLVGLGVGVGVFEAILLAVALNRLRSR